MTVFIYGLTDPRTGIVRYVGKTVDLPRRLRDHLRMARTRKGKATRLDCWIKSLSAAGITPEAVVLEETTDDLWEDRERFWIASLENLVNLTAGGDGVTMPRTEAWKANQSAALKGRVITQSAREQTSATIRRQVTERGCKNGHQWTDENTLWGTKDGRPYRVCKTCRNAASREWRRATGKLKGRRTVCKFGHPLCGDNLRILVRDKSGITVEEHICRECVRIRNRRAKAKARQSLTRKETE